MGQTQTNISEQYEIIVLSNLETIWNKQTGKFETNYSKSIQDGAIWDKENRKSVDKHSTTTRDNLLSSRMGQFGTDLRKVRMKQKHLFES